MLLLRFKLDLNLRRNMKCYIWGAALYGANTKTLRKEGQKNLKTFEVWRWRGMEVSSADHARN
jgi:hypothetical protein